MDGTTGRRLRVEYLPIEALKPNQRNPRVHPKRQIDQLAASILALGINVPILINKDNRIIAGHARWLACRQLGFTEVPVIRLEHLTEAQARAFAIADNRLAETSDWDERLLAECLLELTKLDLDFTIEATGFSTPEIDLRIESLSSSSADAPDPTDELPAAPGGPAVTKAGDLWLCDRHRVLCANALEGSAYGVLMQGARAQMVFTDPPYNVPIDGHVSGKGRTRHREFAMASGEMDEAGFVAFLTRALKLLAVHSDAGSVHFLCMDWRHVLEIVTAGRAAYTALLNLCVWIKHNGGMGSLYRSRHELIFVFKSGIGRHRNNVELGRFGRNRTNVWEYQGASGFGRHGEEGDLSVQHPTLKPVQMVADAILDCSARADIVLDPFLGSGTTLIAAERVGRVCHGMEIDPLYVDCAIRRWQRHTGQHAVHAVTGQPFDGLAREAEAGHD